MSVGRTVLESPKMEILEPARSERAPGTVKIVLPMDLRMKLHAIKVLKGVSIAETVQAALEMYFEEMARRREAERRPEPSEPVAGAS